MMVFVPLLMMATDAYTIAGVQALMGSNWDPTDTNNDMSLLGDGTYVLVKQNVELEVNTNPGVNAFVTRSIDNLSKQEKPADLVLERAFLNVVWRLSPEKKYTKLAKKVHRISRSEKYTLTKRNELITKIINKYNAKLDDNQIGYVATIAKLPEKQQQELIENLNILSMDGERYVNLVEQARTDEKQLKRVAYKLNNYDELKNDIHSKGNEIRGKANAALNFANKVRKLVEYAGIIID